LSDHFYNEYKLTIDLPLHLPGGAFDEADGRLPYTNIPYHYNLELTPDIYQDGPPFSFTGTVQIYFTAAETSSLVTVNSNSKCQMLLYTYFYRACMSVSTELVGSNPFTPLLQS